MLKSICTYLKHLVFIKEELIEEPIINTKYTPSLKPIKEDEVLEPEPTTITNSPITETKPEQTPTNSLTISNEDMMIITPREHVTNLNTPKIKGITIDEYYQNVSSLKLDEQYKCSNYGCLESAHYNTYLISNHEKVHPFCSSECLFNNIGRFIKIKKPPVYELISF